MLNFFRTKNFKDFHDNYLFWIKTFFLTLVIFGLIISLFISPADYLQGDTVRIMYVHVPASWLALQIFAVMSICGFITLILKTRVFTLIAKSIAPIGFTFSLISLFTGSIWGQPTWGLLDLGCKINIHVGFGDFLYFLYCYLDCYPKI